MSAGNDTDSCELDYVKTAISLATVGLKKPFPILASLFPHFIVLGAFGAFVLWNNGVVLGKDAFCPVCSTANEYID
jgi:hypothetical protein